MSHSKPMKINFVYDLSKAGNFMFLTKEKKNVMYNFL